MADEYTTITVDMARIDGTAPNGTLYADLAHVVTLENNDVVSPEKRSFAVTAGNASIQLACTATAIKGVNAPYVISFAPTGGAERILGRIIPTPSPSPLNLSDLLEVGATAIVTTRTLVATSQWRVATSIAALQALRGMGADDRTFVPGIGIFRFSLSAADAAVGSLVVVPSSGAGRWFLDVDGVNWRTAINVMQYGATGKGEADDYAAINMALAAAASLASPTAAVFFPAGNYRITQSLVIPKGVHLIGDSGFGQGTWTQLQFAGSGDFLTFNGADGVGGGKIQDLLISRATQSGGDAIKLIATSGAARPGEFVISNVLVTSFDGVQTWGRGLHIDGTAANTIGSKGVRTVRLDKFRVADVSTAGESIYINQVAHLTGTHVEVDPGMGSAAGIKTAGENANVSIVGLICNGDFVLAGTTSNVKMVGLVGGDLNIGASCTGVDCLVNGATLTVASGATGSAQGYWSGAVSAPSTTFIVANAKAHRLLLGAGTMAAGTAPAKLQQGDLMTTPENGAIEFDTSGFLYFTGSGTTRDRIFTGRTATAILDFPSIAAGASADLTFTLPGAGNGQAVIPMWPPSLPAGLVGTMFVSAADTITVRLANNTASAIDYGGATFGAVVLR